MPKGEYNSVNYEIGTPIAGVVIQAAAESLNGKRWKVMFPCQHAQIVLGIALRAAVKRGGNLRCWTCRAKAK